MKDINTFNFSLSKVDKNFIVSLLLSEKGSLFIIKLISLSKILEEPKLNTYFFLISHQPSSLLPTIKSRCLKINLSNHNYDNFSRIIKISNPDIDEETNKFLYDISNGSPGLINEYEFDEILNIFERLINLIINKDPFLIVIMIQ